MIPTTTQLEPMLSLLQREFTVNVGLQRAWDDLACIEQWPSWAHHIKQIELRPPGKLGPQSTGVIHLTIGVKSAFRMTEFNPPRNDSSGGLRSDSDGGLRSDSGGGRCNWKWAGPFLWLTVIYDHQFEALDDEHTSLVWTVAAEGIGARVLGPLFARIYRGNMERAIGLLIREMNARPAGI